MRRVRPGPRFTPLLQTTPRQRQREVIIGATIVLLAVLVGFALGLFWGGYASRRGEETPSRLESLLEAPRDLPEPSRSTVLTVTRTAYNPVPEQTWGDPCIGASGKNLCEMAKQGKRIIATTPDLSLPFGTRVRIEGHIYEVWDRMPTSRYDFQRKRRVPQTQAVDIFTFDYAEAMRLGRRQVQMEVLDD